MKVAIIGAGLGGLSCAYRLEQLGFRGKIDIFEKKKAVGDGNVFMEFLSELFHRPITDFFAYIGEEYKLYLQPLHTIYHSQSFGPTTSATYEGYLGHVVVRGNHEQSLERQLEKKIESPIHCNQQVNPKQLQNQYDHVIIATGRLQDVPQEVPIRLDRYVRFYHALIEGDFDVHKVQC